jgi:hypothetical protein
MAVARNLVVVRCGDASLHHQWLAEGRNWDLGVSYFGAGGDEVFDGAEYRHRFRGGKWDGISDFFESHPEALQCYDYVWLPDDDIETNCNAINTVFDSMRQNAFELAQPSLSKGSYVSHLITLHNPAFRFRRVNFVELMVPVLSKDLLLKVLPLFRNTRSGFGLDFIWHRFTTRPSEAVAIIDSVQVKHTRAVGGALHAMMKSEGQSPARQEQDVMLAPYGTIEQTELTLGGVLASGSDMRSPFLAKLIAAGGYLSSPSGNCGFTHRIAAWRFSLWVIRHLVPRILRNSLTTQIDPILPDNTIANGANVRDAGKRRLA